MFPNFSCFGWCCSSNEDSIPARAIETATGAVQFFQERKKMKNGKKISTDLQVGKNGHM
jgi:hypothetical protein